MLTLHNIWLTGAILYGIWSIKYTGFGRPLGAVICALIWPVSLATLGLFWAYRKITKMGFKKDPTEVEMTLCLTVALLIALVCIVSFRVI
jgi:hypothetical protein